MTYPEAGSQGSCCNLAFEEYVLTNRLEGDYPLVWQNDDTIVIGQNQNAEAEINRVLSHAAASFTLNVYAHTSDQMKKDTAARMQNYCDNLTAKRHKAAPPDLTIWRGIFS